MFSHIEQAELAARLKHIRRSLPEDAFWNTAFPLLNRNQGNDMEP